MACFDRSSDTSRLVVALISRILIGRPTALFSVLVVDTMVLEETRLESSNAYVPHCCDPRRCMDPFKCCRLSLVRNFFLFSLQVMDVKVLEAAKADSVLKTATFAGGCFWGLELAFQRAKGVVSTKVLACHELSLPASFTKPVRFSLERTDRRSNEPREGGIDQGTCLYRTSFSWERANTTIFSRFGDTRFAYTAPCLRPRAGWVGCR